MTDADDFTVFGVSGGRFVPVGIEEAPLETVVCPRCEGAKRTSTDAILRQECTECGGSGRISVAMAAALKAGRTT